MKTTKFNFLRTIRTELGKLSTTDRIALSGVILSTLAFIVSIYAITETAKEFKETTELTRKTQDLELKRDSLSMIPNLQFSTMYGTFPYAGIAIKNYGLGPAVVQNVIYKLDGKTYKDMQEIVDVFESDTNNIHTNVDVVQHTLNQGCAIMAGEEIKLLYIDPMYKKYYNKEHIDSLLDRTEIIFTYKGLYNPTVYLDSL